jgi:hypothetical protein
LLAKFKAIKGFCSRLQRSRTFARAFGAPSQPFLGHCVRHHTARQFLGVGTHEKFVQHAGNAPDIAPAIGQPCHNVFVGHSFRESEHIRQRLVKRAISHHPTATHSWPGAGIMDGDDS